MIRAVLLDLDNTMVLFDEAVYVEEYFKRLRPWFSDLFSDSALEKQVFSATAALRHNAGTGINREFFLDRFCNGTGIDRGIVWDRFLRFYATRYADIRIECAVADGLDEVLGRLGRSGLKLVLASNPVFPRIAQEIRMSWGGVSGHLFDLFTHIDNMFFVKPRPDYYRQICDMLREPPAACLMVGNDPVGDMAAKLAGLKTYRTTDAEEAGFATITLTDIAGDVDPEVPEPDFTGPFSEVIAAIRDLHRRFPADPQAFDFGRRRTYSSLRI